MWGWGNFGDDGSLTYDSLLTKVRFTLFLKLPKHKFSIFHHGVLLLPRFKTSQHILPLIEHELSLVCWWCITKMVDSSYKGHQHIDINSTKFYSIDVFNHWCWAKYHWMVLVWLMSICNHAHTRSWHPWVGQKRPWEG
jgi:hypothetical protein